MKNFIIAVGLILVVSMNALSQTADSSITQKRNKYFQFGQKLRFSDVKDRLANNVVSAPELQKYKTIIGVGTAFYVTGTVVVIAGAGISLANAVEVANYNRNERHIKDLKSTSNTGSVILLSGMLIDVVGAIVSSRANKHFKKSISLYNSSFKSAGRNKVQFNYMVNGSGVGVRMRF